MLIIVFISHENLLNFGNLCDHLTAFGFLSPETCFTYCFIKKNKEKQNQTESNMGFLSTPLVPKKKKLPQKHINSDSYFRTVVFKLYILGPKGKGKCNPLKPEA